MTLTPEEQALMEPFFRECDRAKARAEGVQQGLEAAKQILLKQIMGMRKASTEHNDGTQSDNS